VLFGIGIEIVLTLFCYFIKPKTLEKINPIFLCIEPTGKKQISVSIGYSVYYNQEDEKNMMSCYIPGFNISFSAKNAEAMDKKAKALVHSFVDYFFIHAEEGKQPRGGLKGITLELHKLGFKAANDMITVKKLINNEVVKAKFKSIEGAPSYYDTESMKTNELQMSVAV